MSALRAFTKARARSASRRLASHRACVNRVIRSSERARQDLPVRSQKEIGQLVKRIGHLDAQNDERSNHQIEAEMHRRRWTKCFLRPRVSFRESQKKSNSILTGDDCRSFEPRWIRRQRLSSVWVSIAARLTLFCNARCKRRDVVQPASRRALRRSHLIFSGRDQLARIDERTDRL